MASTDDAADAALNAVLGEAAPDDAAESTEVILSGSTDGADTGDLIPDAFGAGDDDDLPPTCTMDQAVQMTDEMRAGLLTFDTALSQAMATRAWKRLGYATPRDFVLTELGPAKAGEVDGKSRVSRAHAYRLARVAVLLYELARRIGEEAYSLELTERAIRAIPAKYDGQMLDRMEDAFASKGGDLNAEDAKDVVDGVITDARKELHDTGALSSPGQEPVAHASAGDELARLGMDDVGPFRSDDHAPNLDDGDSPTASDTGSADDGTGSHEQWAGTQSSSDRDGMREAFTVESASDDALTEATALRELLTWFGKVPELSEKLPGILDSASSDELADLSEQAQQMLDTIAAIRDHAEERL